ncbi:MAG TPA: MG2 domain-containing protein [Phycisphaerae bacterium]|nr:MG2 domain-containing protein [Phycisphaerae bacterium]HRY70811.1 MG2 domain-containing protein [Phycisphaerae bacterium]HSA28316.1 MG2 domain-containing protein [Phycisphaerae bacterium]
MAQRSFKALAVALIILNGLGLLWIRHELLARGSGRARILSALPGRNVARTDRLSLVFDEPIAAAALLGQRLERQPFAISPPVAGHWTWSQPDRLDFVLDKPLAPGRVFKVKAASDLESQIGRRIIGPTEFRYETGALLVTFCDFYSADKESVSLQLTFNQPVNPKDLARNLELKPVGSLNPYGVGSELPGAPGEAMKLTILTRETTDRIIVRCPRPRTDKIEASVRAGLIGSGGELPLAANFTRQVDIPAVFALMRAETGTPTLDNAPSVRLDFSSPLARRQPTPKVHVEPPVPDLRPQINSYGGGMLLTGSFQCGTPYRVTVGAEAQSENGLQLGHDQTVSFQIPEYEPGVNFPRTRGILAPGGNLELDLEAVNAANLDIAVTRVYQNNLVSHARGDNRDATSKSMARKTLALQLERNKPTKLALELRTLIDGWPGVYWISATVKERSWSHASSIVAISDLGLTRKRDRDGYLVWVTSLKTARPVPGAEVAAMTYNNQVLATATTGADGLARLSIKENHPDGQPWLLTARLGDDLNFMTQDNHDWLLEQADTGGREYPVNYDVMMYTERGVYRPGQTVHLTGLVRDESGRIPPPFPLDVTVKRLDGKVVQVLRVTPDPQKQGFFQVDFVTRDDGMLGRHTFTATLPGAAKALGQTDTIVADFAPVRMEVTARPSKETFLANDMPTIEARARYLFGQPASGLPITTSGEYRRVSFRSKSMPDYTFTDPNEGREVRVLEIEAQLDKEGQARIEVPLSRRKPVAATSPAASPPTNPGDTGAGEPAEDRETQASDDEGDDSADPDTEDKSDSEGGDQAKPGLIAGLWEGSFSVTVTEPGSRSVSEHVTLRLNTINRHLGLKLPGKLVPTGRPVPVSYVQMTGDDKPAEPAPFRFTLHRIERDYALKIVNHRTVWQTTEHLIQVAEGEIDPSKGEPNDSSFSITCASPGPHRLIVVDSRSASTTRLDFHATDNASADQIVTTDNPEQLDIVLDRPDYTPGSEARILVKSPFTGTMLITLETDRVVRQQVMAMASPSAEIRWQIPTDVRGGAFVTATVVRPVDPSRAQWLPHRAMGMARLLTDHKMQELPVAIDAPAELLPAAKTTVTVKSPTSTDPSRPAMLHLWAVDESILLTTKYETPDPLMHFFEPREAAVASSDLFDELMPDHRRAASILRIGGDGHPNPLEKDAPSAPLPLRTADVRSKTPAVVWRTVASVGPDGLTRVEMDTPDLTGELRLMAVVVDGDCYGSAERGLKLAAPVLVETGWPRFVAPGDRFAVPVKIFNSTGKPMKVDLEITPADGPIAVAQPKQPAIMVPASQPVTIWLDAEARSIGQVAIRVRAAGATEDGQTLAAESRSEFTVRPAAAFHSQSHLRRIKAGETVSLSPPKELIAGSVRATLGIDARPSVQLQPALEQLIQYPYGCLEQVTSQLYALLHLPDLLAQNDRGGERAQEVGRMIDAGIVRLWSMQTGSGGLSLWARETNPYLWGSAYVGTFLLQARRTGVKVDPQFTDALVSYLQEELQQPSGAQGPDMDDNMRALLCHVLAGFDRPPQGWMARLTEKAASLGMAGRADLAAAWMHNGRKDRARTILFDSTMDQVVTLSTGGRLTSQVREQAVLLNALMDLDPGHPWIPTLVQRLETARREGTWGTTLENASALAALARYQSQNRREETSFEGTVRVGNDRETAFNHRKPLAMRISEKEWPVQIVTQGTGEVYLSVVYEGLLPPTEVKPFDRQLIVRRKWLNRDGKPLDVKTLKVGDLIHVEVELAAPTLTHGERIENVCVVDALPGGTEAEDPQLATSAVSSADQDEEEAECRTEIRDDRVLLFTTAGKKPTVHHYAVRVAAAGTFVVPPIEASCMYDPQFGSLNGGGTITVRK